MGSPDTQEQRPSLHKPESGFGLRLEDIGGVSRWSRKDMLGEERSKHIMDESIAVFAAEGWMHEDPETGEAYISERPDGKGKNMRMSDVLPTDLLDGRVEIEIIIRAREIPEHEEVKLEGETPMPLWETRTNNRGTPFPSGEWDDSLSF